MVSGFPRASRPRDQVTTEMLCMIWPQKLLSVISIAFFDHVNITKVKLIFRRIKLFYLLIQEQSWFILR